MSPLRILVILLLINGMLLVAGCTEASGLEKIPATSILQTTPAVQEPEVTIQITVPTQSITQKITQKNSSDNHSAFSEPREEIRHVARGDPYKIFGRVTNSTASQAVIWLIGENYIYRSYVPVDNDGFLSYEINSVTTRVIKNGPLYIIIQNPGKNGQFDILPSTRSESDTIGYVIGFRTEDYRYYRMLYSGYDEMKYDMRNSSMIVRAELDRPENDDEYTTQQLQVEDPWIYVNSISPENPLIINGTTNLAPGNKLRVQLYPLWFNITQTEITPDSGLILEENSSIIDTIIIQNGPGTVNTWTIMNRNITLLPDKYHLNVFSVNQDVENKTILLVEG
jgi:hypothetical protein